ncbi:unnamed protein product [Protopolystoma xenopodis]|uniref:Uncharacterized protein n=1 Tax=Protopolystoma xenopodis TaxID=117903 RepID=A0A3S5AKX4_9PLAT|nr:unnamed protein product [Protopolystoma xenopodis]
MISFSDDVRHMTHKNLAPFYRNRSRLPRKQRQRESSSKVIRQLVKRNPPSSSGIRPAFESLRPKLTRNGSKLNELELLKLN